MTELLHRLPEEWLAYPAPERFTYPFAYRPHPWARLAAEEVLREMHAYMVAHPSSELHSRGKMFGVLVVDGGRYLRAFSALLDGSFLHEGFVPPVFDWSAPDGFFRTEETAISALRNADSTALRQERRQRSRALQRRLFGEYHLLNSLGESATPLDIFREEKQLLTEEEWVERRQLAKAGADLSNIPVPTEAEGTLPPSGTGDCCAPKLLQYAYSHKLRPICIAEFWIGASPEREIREDGAFYPACSGRCKPLLRYMLKGIEVDTNPLLLSDMALAEQTKIIYEDRWIAVVVKPSGLLTIPAKDGGYSLTKWAYTHICQTATPAHRLDQDTSGLVIISKNPETTRRLQEQFEQRKVKKHYEAVLVRVPERPEEGVIELPLMKNPLDSPRQMVSFEHGKPSVTRYKIRRALEDGRCIVDFYPLTGRTHQLRIHAAHHLGLGVPIAGDRLYGIEPSDVGPQKSTELYLHAAEIEFVHPATGKTMRFSCPKF